MPRYKIPLTAGKTERLPYKGQMLQLVDLGAAASVSLGVEWTAQEDLENIGDVETFFRVYSATERFNGIELTSSVDTTVDVLVSYRDMQVNRNDGSTVVVDSTTPVRVEIAAAAADADDVAVAVTSAGAALLAANGARRSARFYNQGASPVAIGGATLTWAKRVIVINPGDVWVESDGANLAWYGVTDAATTATVGIQEITQ